MLNIQLGILNVEVCIKTKLRKLEPCEQTEVLFAVQKTKLR